MSPSPNLLTPASVSATLVAGVQSHLEALAERFFPGFHLPGFLLGQRLTAIDPADLAYDLAWLWKLGVKDVGGMPVPEAIRRVLRRVDGPRTQIFYSYRVAEALLAFGPTFAGNPLLEGFSEAERENLRVATDTTAIYDPATGTMPGYPNNYWAVLARCEQRRRDLGLLTDPTILDLALAGTKELLFRNPAGFFDDSPEGGGKFDIYTADVHLFCEPLWPTFDQDRLRANLRAHVALFESGAQENGAAFAWGRSVGALSVCLTMELGAVALSLGMSSDPVRMLGLVEHARQRYLADWLDPEDGLITSHRGRATEAYRGPYRQLQVTVDTLGKLLYTAKHLASVPEFPAPASPPELFPAVDHYASFVSTDAPRPAGLWAFRNEQLSFGLALTHGSNSDYAPSPRAPGLFENPVDSPLICALPRAAQGDRDFAPVGRPVLVEKLPGGLRVVHDGFPCTSDANDGAQLPARREAVYRVEGDALAVSEHWTFAETPDALTWHLPEPAGRPLCLEVTEQPDGAHVSVANVNGINLWRSAWGEAGRLHQVNFQPAREVRFAYRVRRQPRVFLATAEHDYPRLLYTPMLPEALDWSRRAFSRGLPTDPDELAARVDGCDVIHLHWPEWSFAMPEGVSDAERERLLTRAVQTLGRLPVRVVWTMHNRRPHSVMPADRGRAFYRATAAVADGVIHHSRWGMALMRGELPYKPTARHVVAAHGHLGSVNPPPAGVARAELETRFGLVPCAVRFGVIGRPQKEKQTELIVRAFRAGAQPGQQLFVTATTPETVAAAGDDPRVIARPRAEWLSREEIAAQLHVCDCIVNALTGDTYLTSGTSADAIGLGLAMLVPEWEFFRETLGDAAFYHDNTEAGLAALFARLTPEDIGRSRERMAALQEATDWKTSADTTLGLLRSLPFRKGM